jgi:hypothetical protein
MLGFGIMNVEPSGCIIRQIAGYKNKKSFRYAGSSLMLGE